MNNRAFTMMNNMGLDMAMQMAMSMMMCANFSKLLPFSRKPGKDPCYCYTN